MVIACWLDVDAITRVLLISSVMLVMIVEILNSAIEAVVDRIGSEYHELSGRAKDMGSAAVLIAIIVAVITWCILLWSHFWITLPDFDKSLVYCAVYGSKIAFCCIYSQHNCIYTQGGGMKALTAGQQEVFDLIRDHISQTGMPPTRAEIAQRLGFRSPKRG